MRCFGVGAGSFWFLIDDIKGGLRSGSKMLNPLRLESMSVTKSLTVKNTLGHFINSIFEFFDYNLRICY